MLPLKLDKKTGTVIATVIFLLAAWMVGSLFYTLPHVTEEGTPPGYSAEPVEEVGGAPEPINLPWRLLRWTVLGLALAVIFSTALLKIFTEKRVIQEFFMELLTLGGVLLFFVTWRFLLDLAGGVSNHYSSSGLSGGFSPAGHSVTEAGQSNIFIPIIIMAALVGFLLVRVALTFLSKEEEVDVEKDVTETIDRTLSDLYKGKDARSAIIRCYIEMSHHLEQQGVSERDSFTPREFRTWAMKRLDLGIESLEVLTSMFEKARYSHHPLSIEEKEQAIESLEDLKEQLEVVE